MPETAEIVRHMVVRELTSLKREIDAYPNEASLWVVPPGISNSAGTLALHCAGNIQHFIGSRLAGTGYVRNRDLEFSRRNVPRSEILSELDHAIAAAEQLGGSGGKLPGVFPDNFGGKQVRTDVMLVHLASHLAYHLGQVDYHRRLTTGQTGTVDAVAAAALPPAL